MFLKSLLQKQLFFKEVIKTKRWPKILWKDIFAADFEMHIK